MRSLLALMTCSLVAALAAAPGAVAQGPPTMPLAQVTKGMHCTADTVVRGTAISTFDVDIIDVLTGDTPDAARILFRASGPDVDASGVAEGFSGSPIWCADAVGTRRIIGAISQGTGEYGNAVALATPIAAMLGTPVDPPPVDARRNPGLLRAARPLASPLTVSGLSPTVAKAVQAAAAAKHRTVLVAPSTSRAIIAPQTLRPGSSVSTMYSSGDIAFGAIGTVTYTDGDKVWAFGHSLDGVGARSLMLGDAYVYAVINNPLGLETAVSAKLAAPVNSLGTVTFDGLDAVTGRIGPSPARIPITVVAHDGDRDQAVTLHAQVADERALGLPGGDVLSLIAPAAIAEANARAVQSNPTTQSSRMCLQITLRGRKKPFGFCNRYVGSTEGISPMAGDAAAAVSALDSYRFGVPRVTSVRAETTTWRKPGQAYLTSVEVPRVVRRGHDVTARLGYRMVGTGARATRAVKVHVPARMAPGIRTLRFDGTPADGQGSGGELISFDVSAGGETPVDSPGFTSVAAIVNSITAMQRTARVTVKFVRRGRSAGGTQTPVNGTISTARAAGVAHAARAQTVLESDAPRLSGRVTARILVR